MLTATSAASAGSRIAQPVTTDSRMPIATPTEVTTSDNRCRPSAASAGERCFRPCRISTQLQPALIRLATPLSARPIVGAAIGVGFWIPAQASRRINSAATMISDPASTALKYSTL